MDAARIQSVIYKGYGKEATVMGSDYALYRAASPMTPIQPNNYYGTIRCLFLADAKASVANKYQTPTWILRADGNNLRQFDILIGDYGTFFVASMQPMLPMEAVRCNATISIGRVSYQADPDFGTMVAVTTNYAEGLPMFKQYRREDIRRDSTTGAEIGNAITHWRAFIPLNNGTLQQGDVITDEKLIQYTVDAPDFTSAGYAANIRLATL